MASTVEGERTLGRRRLTRIVVIVAVLIAAAAVGYAGIRDALQNSDARTALSDYLKDVQRGDYSGAYGQLCRAVLPGYAEQDHERYLKAQPSFVSFDLDNATTATSDNAVTVVTFSVHFTDAAGRTSVARISVDMQDDGAHVCDGPGRRGLQ